MANVYDTEGLNLYYPNSNNDLILEYSTDNGVTWNYLSTVITGGVDLDTVEQKDISITTTGISGEYKLRLRNALLIDNNTVGKEYYAIDEISLTGSYVSSGVRDKIRAETRREAWHLDFSPQTISIGSHNTKNSPPAYWTRNVRSKRPVNIENKKINSLGNFKNNYEILQTSGRRITNSLIVDGLEASDVLTTQFISNQKYSIGYDFAYDTIDQPINNDILESAVGDIVKSGGTFPYIGVNGLVLKGKPGSTIRYLSLKQKFTGISTVKVRTLHGRREASLTYDFGGYSLERPDNGENLAIQISYNYVDWQDYEIFVTGSNTFSTTEEVEERNDEIVIDTIRDPYFIRIKQTSHSSTSTTSFDQYVILSLQVDNIAKFPYSLPQLDKETGSKSVIVERFNAPGNKEESSRGALDREGEEMSPNIPLSFRNHYTRKNFYDQLSKNTPQFGGTIHQVNRNRLIRGGKEYFDNGFITHAIPRTDIQYSWITASSNTTAEQLGGYQSFRRSDSTEFVYNKNEAYTDIDFISGSLVLNDSQEYFVDSAYLRSLVKDKKSVNLETNTFTITNPGISASFSEITGMGHSHTTWTSLRVGDSITSRQMRKNNILSILDSAKQIETEAGPIIPKRGDSSTNYTDPVVTFKYKPLEHIVSLGTEDAIESKLTHDYANQMSTFANKELLKRLNKEDQTSQFYELLREQIRVPEESSIFYKSHQYNEIVWPREENTSLNKTRKRVSFVLDQPGFGEDGYDVQLGKQRVFWKTEQEERQRSDFADGGHYNSFGYLSTEETGSSFLLQSISPLTTVNDEQYYFETYYTQNLLDKGLFGSLINLEYYSNERTIFSGAIAILDSGGDIKNIVYKQGIGYENSGEFNSLFVDFYGTSTVTGSQVRFDLGAIYRNTSYKTILTNKPYNFSSSRVTNDSLILIKTEDDELLTNPRMKYLAFIGGGELNTGSYITSNFYQEVTSSIPSNLFLQNLEEDDVLFSTIDNGLLRTTEVDSGKQPFFDTYEDFYEEMRGIGKDYSVIPEFRISEHMDYYVRDKSANFRSENKSFLHLNGGAISSSSDGHYDLFDRTFIKTYATSDILKKNRKIQEESEDISRQKSITIEVSGIKKLLPYNGFYPQDRITQIANIYGDFVNNSLGGGILNMSYEDALLNRTLIENHPRRQTTLGTINCLDIVKNNETFYIALGYHYYNSSRGLVKIFSCTADSILDESSEWILEKTFVGISSGQNLGTHCQFVVANNNTHILISDRAIGTNSSGSLNHSKLNEQGIWSDLTTIVTGTSNSYFGNDFEAQYLEEENKIVIAVGAYYDSSGGAGAGAAYFVTSSDEGENWTDRITVATGSAADLWLGTSVTFLSSSDSNYYIFASQPRRDANGLVDAGTIVVASSSDGGETWTCGNTTNTSSLPAIATGSQSYTYMGYAGMKCVEYNNRTYVFYAEPTSDAPGQTNVGKVYVVYSEPNNDWSNSAANPNKILLNQGTYSYDALTRRFIHYKSIDAKVANNQIYYSFGAIDANSPIYTNSGRVYIGYSADGIEFQTGEDMTSIYGDKNSDFLGPSVSLISENGATYTIYSDKENVYTTSVQRKALSINLLVSGSEIEKRWKTAAIEPIMGPGILFNTIKSGISVDWPCSSGSTRTYQNANGVSVSSHYPQNKTMQTYSTDDDYYSINGSIRSNINYRASFQKILFPRDIFQQKPVITNNITEYYPNGSSYPFIGSKITDLVEGTYFYGGYEPYMSRLDFGDVDEQAPKRFSIPFVYSKESGTDSGLYTLAINNFLAECVRFFLREQKIISFTSGDEDSWLSFDQGKTYYMDVVMKKSEDLVIMEAYHGEKYPIGPQGQKMNGRYFGYPVNKTNKLLLDGEELSPSERRLMHNDPAYAPYTPPYLEGETIARISFTPDDGSRRYSLKEVFAKAKVSNIFRGVEQGASETSDAYIHAMPLASSLELFGFANPVKVTINEQTGQRTIENQTDKQAWVISPFMETPVLDFSDQQIVSSSNNYLKTGGFGRGMWSGYGKIPDSSKSIKISIQDSFPTNVLSENSTTGSLLSQTGFSSSEKKIGQIAEQKDISEALVLIPYLENPVENYTEEVLKNENIHFIKADKNVVYDAIQQFEIGNINGRTSIMNTIEASKKYVLPPNLDYVQYRDIHPYVMYIAEFNETLQQQDLVDIWQGLMPSISYNARIDKITINHDFNDQQFFGQKGIPNDLRWMVFKIKKKAEMNYFKVTKDTRDDNRFEFNKILGRTEATDIHSYNWPYDYFSLVELAKVQVELEYEKKE